MSSSSSSSLDEALTEASVATRIGAGSFATVFSLRGNHFLFKVVRHTVNADQLEREFHALYALHQKCNSDSLFAIPRAIAYFDPVSNKLINFPASPARARVREPRAHITDAFFAPVRNFNNAVYAMDRASSLPTPFGEVIREKFYSSKAKEKGIETPLLCRLYFGKVVTTSNLFINSVNFPIDAMRYSELLGHFPSGELFPLQDVCTGMGQTLSLIHWHAGFDARDVEFVMGGMGIASVRYYVIDFNQMRPFNVVSDDVDLLVDAFFQNDPYYPRPLPLDANYVAFREGYLQSCPDSLRSRAQEFLQRIESCQSRRTQV